MVPSFSRLRVSNDNAYAEALFRTAKYCPLWPERPFETIEQAREWVLRFAVWYNEEEHRHSVVKYVRRHSAIEGLIGNCIPARLSLRGRTTNAPRALVRSDAVTGRRRRLPIQSATRPNEFRKVAA